MVLLSAIQRLQRKQRQARVLVLGLDNAGKSTLVAQMLKDDLNMVQPTVGFQIRTLSLPTLTLNLWDVGGQQSLRPFWHNYFESTDLLLWVVDAAAPHRLDSCRDELRQILDGNGGLKSAEVLVFVNKIDAVSLSEREKLAENVASRLGVSKSAVHLCSAANGAGVEEGLKLIENAVSLRMG